MDIYTQVDHKVFFVPDIYVVDSSNKTYHLGYADKQTGDIIYDAWAGRIMPNQTVGQAIEHELAQTLDYNGGFMIKAFQEAESITDNHNRLTPRYIITLVLNKKVHQGLEVFGRKTILQEEIVNERDSSEENYEASKLLEDPEIKAILEEYGQLYHDYETDDEVYNTLDDIANEWLLNDLSEAEAKDLKEQDPAVRNAASNAEAVKAKIYAVELKMQQINPQYVPSVYEPMKLGDWNPPLDASDEEFFKELAYYFGEQAADIYLSERSGRYDESTVREGVQKALHGAVTDTDQKL